MARTSVEQNERKRERTTRWRISWGKRDKLTRSGARCSRGVTSRRCEKGPQKWDRCNKRKSSKCAELWRYSFARMKDKRQAENYLICQANEQFSQRGCLTYRHSSPVFQTNNLNAILTFVTAIKLPSAKLVTYKTNDKSHFKLNWKGIWARAFYRIVFYERARYICIICRDCDLGRPHQLVFTPGRDEEDCQQQLGGSGVHYGFDLPRIYTHTKGKQKKDIVCGGGKIGMHMISAGQV